MSNSQEIAKNFIESQFSQEMMISIRENEIEKIKKYVVETKAWSDATISLNYQNKVIDNKDQICKLLLTRFADLPNENSFILWHKNTLGQLKDLGMNLGMGQKIINMAAKYFYFLEIGFELKLFEYSLDDYKDSFDIPLDSYILKWFIYNSQFDDDFSTYGNEFSAWSKLTSDDVYYEFLQPKIKELMNKREASDLPLLCSETLVWENIKKLKNYIAWDFTN